MLQNQLNPHFLFNSMNSVRALIFENKEKAAELITKLSDFLKFNLNLGDKTFIDFEMELKAIKNYLAIEKFRYENDLQIEYQIGQKCLQFKVISNILLPIVDNAVKHGFKTGSNPLKIAIDVKKHGDKLHIEVSNSGFWINSKNYNINTGKGLKIVEERLKNIYGDNYQFNILKNNNKVTVLIEIPEINEENLSQFNY